MDGFNNVAEFTEYLSFVEKIDFEVEECLRPYMEEVSLWQ